MVNSYCKFLLECKKEKKVTCCNVVNKGRLLRSFPSRFINELFKLIRTVNLLHVLARIIQARHI